MPTEKFVPALIVVDFQEDFCPPSGSLPIPDGRDIASTINKLLSLPFVLKIATRDWHPPNHISFNTNHILHSDGSTTYSPSSVSTRSSPDDPVRHPDPYTSSITIHHPSPDSTESYNSLLWPPHCIQDSPGAQLLPTLDTHLLTHTVDKGQTPHLEMYSAFRDPFGLCDSGISRLLKDNHVTHVYVVGLAADFCVADTVLSAVDDDFVGFVVEEATRAAKPEEWEAKKTSLQEKGVQFVHVDGEEVKQVEETGQSI